MFQNNFGFHPLFCTYIPQRLSISFCSCFSCSSVELYSLVVNMKYSVVLYLVFGIKYSSNHLAVPMKYEENFSSMVLFSSSVQYCCGM